jgi:transposase
MARQQSRPLRKLTKAERRELTTLSRSRTAPAAHATRAELLLLVADGRSFQEAARAAGRKSGDAVARLVARFNDEGTAAVAPRHGGGRARVYDEQARERVLREAQRVPTPEQDGTATWSLSTLQKALREAEDGLPHVSTYTLWQVLREAGYRPQRGRTWCPTGTVVRQRKAGRVTVTDPDAVPKKS